MSHVGIEPAKLERLAASRVAVEYAAALKHKYKDKKLVVGVDICDRMRGQSFTLRGLRGRILYQK